MMRVAIVTGAGGGLGREIALGLAGAGYGSVIADIDEKAARATADRIEETGMPARALATDVREPADLNRLVAAAQTLGGLDVLVNNAGGWTPHHQYPAAAPAEWAATINLNLTAPMLLSQLVLDPMRHRGGGAIVNISSSGGIGNESYGSPEYGAAKAGLIRFTSSMATLADTHQVRMMCVAPDWVGLPRAHAQWAALPAAERAARSPLIPPADVVATVLPLIRSGTGGTVIEMRGDAPPRPLGT